MRPIRFTDAHRYPVPYVPANATNVAETFERIRLAMEKPRRGKVTQIKRRAK